MPINRKIKAFERKVAITINLVLIHIYTEGFNFTLFCIGFFGMTFLMAKYIFFRNSLEYFNFMLIQNTQFLFFPLNLRS